MYSAFHGGRFHYRLKDRLLAGEHTRQARDLEILRHTSFRRYGRSVILNIEPDVRFHDRTIGRSASERYGRRYRAIDEWFGGTLGFIRNWSRPRRRIELLQDTGVGIRLGMFIPLDLNTPLLIGGAISWYVGSRSKDQSLNSARLEKGTLLASGFIAGGA